MCRFPGGAQVRNGTIIDMRRHDLPEPEEIEKDELEKDEEDEDDIDLMQLAKAKGRVGKPADTSTVDL